MKKQMRHILLPLIATVMFIISACAVSAEITSVKVSQHSIKLNWTIPSGYNSRIQVKWGRYSSDLNHTASLSGSTKTYTIKNLGSTKYYYVNLYCYNSSGNYMYYTSPIRIPTAPGKITGFKYNFGSNQKGFQASWRMPSGDYNANSQILLKTQSGSTVYSKSLGGTNRVSLSSFAKYNRVLKAWVRAYIKLDGKSYFGPWVKKNVVPGPIIGNMTLLSGNRVRIPWSKVVGATGYDVYLSKSSSSGYKRVKSVGASTLSTVVSSFAGSQFQKYVNYYVKIATKSKYGRSQVIQGNYFYIYTQYV